MKRHGRDYIESSNQPLWMMIQKAQKQWQNQEDEEEKEFVTCNWWISNGNRIRNGIHIFKNNPFICSHELKTTTITSIKTIVCMPM